MTTLLGEAAVDTQTPITPKKFSLLPVLTVLFMLSYGLMTLLIVEQGSTIESQKGLIRDMLHDTVELSAMKGKEVQQRNAEAQRRAQNHQAPMTQVPSNQTPSTQIPANEAPSSQVAPLNQNARNQARQAQKPRSQMPPRPASDLTDERRAVSTI